MCLRVDYITWDNDKAEVFLVALKLGHRYSRQEISKMLGGPTVIYLPYRDKKVVCGCFNTAEEYNPGAPEEVLFGTHYHMPIVEETADLVYSQGKRGEAIPIFIYRGPAQWEYIGDYRCVGLSRDASLIQQKMKSHPRRGKITGILRFEKVQT
jgi:hypothetical protein